MLPESPRATQRRWNPEWQECDNNRLRRMGGNTMTAQTPGLDIMKAIYERRSVRHFSEATVDRKVVLELLKAASWAPSGLNNQPWRFALVWDAGVKESLGKLTRYSSILKSASVLVPVFLDREASYDYVKDCQAVGACLQNLLLAAHAHGLGAVWIGEILKNKDEVVKILDLPQRLELMAVAAIGHPAHQNQSSHRRPLEELIVLEK
jgi:nitroreductase